MTYNFQTKLSDALVSKTLATMYQNAQLDIKINQHLLRTKDKGASKRKKIADIWEHLYMNDAK